MGDCYSKIYEGNTRPKRRDKSRTVAAATCYLLIIVARAMYHPFRIRLSNIRTISLLWSDIFNWHITASTSLCSMVEVEVLVASCWPPWRNSVSDVVRVCFCPGVSEYLSNICDGWQKCTNWNLIKSTIGLSYAFIHLAFSGGHWAASQAVWNYCIQMAGTGLGEQTQQLLFWRLLVVSAPVRMTAGQETRAGDLT